MIELIKHILKEDNDNLKNRFMKSVTRIPYIMESNVDSNLITGIEIENVTFDSRYTEIAGDLIITSWNEDPDLFEFTE